MCRLALRTIVSPLNHCMMWAVLVTEVMLFPASLMFCYFKRGCTEMDAARSWIILIQGRRHTPTHWFKTMMHYYTNTDYCINKKRNKKLSLTHIGLVSLVHWKWIVLREMEVLLFWARLQSPAVFNWIRRIKSWKWMDGFWPVWQFAYLSS